MEGLEVHGDCLSAARRGEFDVPLPRVPAFTLAVVAVLLLAVMVALLVVIL